MTLSLFDGRTDGNIHQIARCLGKTASMLLVMTSLQLNADTLSAAHAEESINAMTSNIPVKPLFTQV